MLRLRSYKRRRKGSGYGQRRIFPSKWPELFWFYRFERRVAARRDGFIYEYVGDVVNSPSFKKRMRDYASEGLKHFYFMMLQKDEVSPPPFHSFVTHHFLVS